MKRGGPRNLRLGLGWLVCLACAPVHAAVPVSNAPYNTNPTLRTLMDAVTFYDSFDNASQLPDMAAGDWTPRKIGTPQLAPGLLGQALVAGEGALLFPDAANWTITTRGALAFWISPLDWNHAAAGNTNLVLSSSSAFYVERQGPLKNADGTWRRLEALLTGVQRGAIGSKGAGCASWKTGEWHLIAVNWSWPQLALSVDGGDFNATQLTDKPDPGLFGGIIVGSQGGDRTLIDEFFCFNRPLHESEIRALYDALAPGKAR